MVRKRNKNAGEWYIPYHFSFHIARAINKLKTFNITCKYCTQNADTQGLFPLALVLLGMAATR